MFDWLFKKKPIPLEAESFCVPAAIFCAWTWAVKMKMPVRIAVQKIDTSTDHVQAEALIYGQWTPLTEVYRDRMTVIPYKRHFDIEPYRYVSLDQFIIEQITFTKDF